MARLPVSISLAVAFTAACLIALPSASAITPLGSWQVHHNRLAPTAAANSLLLDMLCP